MLSPIILAPFATLLFPPVQASIGSYRANGENAGETKRYSNLIYVHAIFMVITFIFLIPLAIFASRFGRYAMGKHWFTVNAISIHAPCDTLKVLSQSHAALNAIAVTTFFPIGKSYFISE